MKNNWNLSIFAIHLRIQASSVPKVKFRAVYADKLHWKHICTSLEVGGMWEVLMRFICVKNSVSIYQNQRNS